MRACRAKAWPKPGGALRDSKEVESWKMSKVVCFVEVKAITAIMKRNNIRKLRVFEGEQVILLLDVSRGGFQVMPIWSMFFFSRNIVIQWWSVALKSTPGSFSNKPLFRYKESSQHPSSDKSTTQHPIARKQHRATSTEPKTNNMTASILQKHQDITTTLLNTTPKNIYCKKKLVKTQY